jgi:hypothetical protein
VSVTLKFVACISWGVQMGTYQQRLAVAKRLSLILHDAANLNFQLSELNRLRERVRKVELSARRSRRGRPDSFSEAGPHSKAREPNPHQRAS